MLVLLYNKKMMVFSYKFYVFNWEDKDKIKDVKLYFRKFL